MRGLLLHHGALEEDLEQMEAGLIHDEVPIDDPPSDHRRVAYHRMFLTSDGKIYPTYSKGITQFPADEIASPAEKGAGLGRNRSATRAWNLPPLSYAKSSIPNALSLVLRYFEPKVHQEEANLVPRSSMRANSPHKPIRS